MINNAVVYPSVTIVNQPTERVDVYGNRMDLHKANIVYLDGVYYLFGVAYGNCVEPPGDGCSQGGAIGVCGFLPNHNVTLYTSPDMATWTPAFERNGAVVFQFAREFPIYGVLFIAKVLYNPSTQEWVMWFNWVDQPNNGWFSVLTSSSPSGPYSIVNLKLNTMVNGDIGDFGLCQHPTTGDAWVMYTGGINGNHPMSIEQLTPDYLATEGASAYSGVIASGVEANAMFYRNGSYYASTGHTCCYCSAGSPVTFYVSSHPLGPYTPGVLMTTSSIAAQQADISRFFDARGNEQWMWMGDMWQSAPNHVKANDFTYMGVITWTPEGDPLPLAFLSSFVMGVGHRPING